MLSCGQDTVARTQLVGMVACLPEFSAFLASGWWAGLFRLAWNCAHNVYRVKWDQWTNALLFVAL